MKASKNFLLLFAFLSTFIAFGQTETDENATKIAAILNNYFDLEREAIHIHVDKTSFLTNEKVWYQGYIINRKTNKPYFTTNIFVVLYDEKGNQISEKLIFASNGTFSGDIALSEKLASGNYYLQAYTNWMNNFSENEATLTKITIINPKEGIKNYKKINPETLEVFINPEGKSFVKNVSNIVGIQFKDCRGNAPENIEATLEDSNGEILKTFKLDKFGLGKFEITPTGNNYKIKVNYQDKVIEKTLPVPEGLGYALEVNNFTMEGKTIVKVKTNLSTTSFMQNKKLYLLVHQDQKLQLYDLETKSKLLEQTVFIDNADLFDGINTVRIVDENMKQWAERLIYLYPKTGTETSIMKNGSKGNQINLVGYTPYPNSSLSLTILPDQTKSWDESNNIICGLTLNPYLDKPLENGNFYLSSVSRAKYYALDLTLLNQEKLKYQWEFMKATTPTINYSFDIGINLKGTVDPKIKDITYHKVKLSSFKDLLMLSADINEKGEYSFEHILIADSSSVNLSLQKLPKFEEVPYKLIPQVVGRKRPFNKPFPIQIPENCNQVETEAFESFDLPKFAANSILLDEIKIENTQKKLTYANKFGNANLRAYKVDEAMLNQTLFSFIESNGFSIVRNFGLFEVYSRLPTSRNLGPAKPDIYVDDRRVMSADELSIIRMNEIDEIYLNPHAIVASMNNNIGIIKIYRKKDYLLKQYYKQNPNLFFIKDGFSHILNFKNSDYQSTQDSGFDNFGLIGWAPRINTDDNGQFLFNVTDYNKGKSKIIIEGMSPEGKLFQEEKLIDLK